jgi:hypothetical protein
MRNRTRDPAAFARDPGDLIEAWGSSGIGETRVPR